MYHAPFRLVQTAELPDAWREPVSQEELRARARELAIPFEQIMSHVCITMPQCSLSMEYLRWSQSQDSSSTVGIMLVNPQTFVDMFGEESVQRFLVALVAAGAPPVQFLHRVFGRNSAPQPKRAGRRA